ncbi:beta family protein [Halomonas elongata]|uniref:beta family protein n=1 Tax=Halomonas elongata TaxID=2746 RepID=UPI00186B67B4|nr:beta family protein [Halomonas elongata]MBW5801341.1 beta family protein [Halomonas elongata]
MSEFLYFPIIKTRDAELRCFGNIGASCFEKMLPIYELTKSRKTKKAPDGDIYRRMKQIGDIQGDRPFILDLSTDERYINPQIEQLLAEQHGFKDWQYFIFDLHSGLNIIPMVHLYEDDSGVMSDVGKFVADASERVRSIAVRLPYDLGRDEVGYYVRSIAGQMVEGCKLYVILDGGFVRDKPVSDVVDLFLDSCAGIEGYEEKIEDVVVSCTSFPSSPANEGRADVDGKFRIYEEEIYQGVVENFPVKYGDYASINIEQIEMKGGTFVPRIDVASLDGMYFTYKRYRRNNGGYVRCAEHTVRDSNNYSPLGVWADDEIKLAASGKPTGISPAFWISVRMSYYIRTRLMLRNDFSG